MWNLNQKKILITGGTKGIGRAAVVEMLKLGAQVLFTARSKDEVAAFEQELREAQFTVTGLVSDMAIYTNRNHITRRVEEHWGALDVLVNNAGINIRKPTQDFTAEEYRKVLGVNLIAPFELSRNLHAFLVKG